MRTDYGLTEDKVKCAPGLDRALSNFAASLPMPQPTSNGLAKHDVTLVTDGPLQGWKDAVHFAFAETSGWTTRNFFYVGHRENFDINVPQIFSYFDIICPKFVPHISKVFKLFWAHL